MKRLTVEPDPLSARALGEMRAAIAGSALVGPSVLGGGFRATRGFAVAFTLAGLDRLRALVPAASPFLDRAIDPALATAFYLNLLVVPAGAAVDAHEDGTLTSYLGLPRAHPVRVSVLYLEAPTRGGALELHRRLGPPTRVAPVAGTLLHFRGDLVHGVTRVEEGLRVSWVLEQYAFDAAALARAPSCELLSDGHFARVLDAATRRA